MMKRAGILSAIVACWVASGMISNAAEKTPGGRTRRILYNLDGDSCMTLKAGRAGPGPIVASDLTNVVAELTAPGSQVDTFLVCVNAQVMYYPTRVGTQRGTLSSDAEKTGWSKGERQRFATMEAFFGAGLDPYAVLINEGRRRGLETLITFRMNDAHGNDFLRTRFLKEHPEWGLPGGALDFAVPEVRGYVLGLIQETMERYNADGLELDFQRFPRFFRPEYNDPTARRACMDGLVRQVRTMLEQVGVRRGRKLVLSVRVPSGMGDFEPTPGRALELGCDVAEWARRGWLDFLTVSEWLFTRETLGLGAWKQAIPNLPIYAAIQPESRSSPNPSVCEYCFGAAGYRRLAMERWRDGADGIYLFNFFTPREWPTPLEPPFEVLAYIGRPETLARAAEGPWETNPPIATVTRLLHDTHPSERHAAMASVQYVGPGLERREWRALEKVSDVADQQRARWSVDNGKTWSDWTLQQPSSLVDYAGVKVWEGGWADTYDLKSGRLVQLWLRQIELQGQFHNVTYVRHSTNGGRAWSVPVPLTYEPGPTFDPKNPANPEFLKWNQGYPGNAITLRRDGTLAVALAHANAPGDPQNDRRAWRMGSVLFLGRWDEGAGEYRWTAGGRTEIEPERSARGLMEPDVAELRDGRLLVVWRGSDLSWESKPAREPGRKWYAMSTDGGRTLGAVGDWRYSDGTRFYSASSIHRLIRHSQTGKLYWFGNVSGQPPRGNHPRHPLVLGEVDEATGGLRRETLTVVAERGLRQGIDVQFSNFSIVEDRVSHAFELWLTTYGQETDPKDWATADCWKYTVGLRR